MLVTPKQNRTNRVTAAAIAISIAIVGVVGGIFYPLVLLAVPLAGLAHWLIRRRCSRRMNVMRMQFPDEWERSLVSHVEYFRILDDVGKERFRNLVKIFLDEVPITGVRTDVDELTRTLVAASAVIPIFGFDDWEYSGLGEVLIYPSAFGDNYRTDDGADRNTLGMIGVAHLSGVMILSKPDLIGGFANPTDKRNVGIHEFSHLVDKADGSVDGIPLGVPAETVRPWIDWVGKELSSHPSAQRDINDYAYTNEAEYFAVLSEYFFESPGTLKAKNPQIYAMLESMYRQDTKSMFSNAVKRRPKTVGRNSPCPCGSGSKFKKCCGVRRKRGLPRRVA